jgi:hypothetical protein
MAGFSSWVNDNFNVIQTVGIIGSLWLAIGTSRREARAKESENLLTIEEQHRELWVGAYERKDLARVFLAKPDLAQPISIAEEEFLRLVISHFQTIWLIARSGGLLTLHELALDAGEFFSLPLPRAVWEKERVLRNPKFVRFVERALDRHGRLTSAGD